MKTKEQHTLLVSCKQRYEQHNYQTFLVYIKNMKEKRHNVRKNIEELKRQIEQWKKDMPEKLLSYKEFVAQNRNYERDLERNKQYAKEHNLVLVVGKKIRCPICNKQLWENDAERMLDGTKACHMCQFKEWLSNKYPEKKDEVKQ